MRRRDLLRAIAAALVAPPTAPLLSGPRLVLGGSRVGKSLPIPRDFEFVQSAHLSPHPAPNRR